ncbi:MAG: hypothetical protein ACE366_29110 [Bradymonadia bacterium]
MGLGCQSAPQPAPQTAAPLAPPQMDLDLLVAWLDQSPLQYDLQEQPRAVDGFESFFQSGFSPVRVPLDRRALQRRLARPRAGSDQQTALEDSVLVDTRGGEAWAAYLAFLAREGRGLPPAPLLPPGTVQLGVDRAEIKYPRGQSIWAFYLACKAAARLEPGFRRLLGAPEAEPYRWTLAEERGCLSIFAQGARRAASEGVQPRGLAAHVLAAARAGVLEGYVVVEAVGVMAPGVLPTLPPGARRAGRAYLRWAARPIAHLPPPAPPLAKAALPPEPLPAQERLRFDAAVTALDAGSLRRAQAVLSDLARRHGRNAEVLRALAEARMRNDDPRGAAEAADQAEAIAPGHLGTWALLARARLAAGDEEGARAAADRLRWQWWLGGDQAIMRAPILFWGAAAGGAVLERLDRIDELTPRFWWIKPHGPGGPARKALQAESPAEALSEAARIGEAPHPQ